MSPFELLIAALAAVVLFLFGLQSFAAELRRVGGDALNTWLARVTRNPWRGFLIGAVATAIVQSSSAISSMTVALVDAGAMSLAASLGVLLGANVGSTATAWLISFKLAGIGPYLIVLGAVVAALPIRRSFLGKPIFFFGFIFFSLELIADVLQPLQQSERLSSLLAAVDAPLMAVAAGVVFTAIVQSSSVTTGLAIVLVEAGIMPPATAVALVIGANVGSTSTALIASIGMSRSARHSALANFAFNLVGMLVYLPFLRPFARWVIAVTDSPAVAVAWANTFFNLSMGVALMLILPRLARWLPALATGAHQRREHT